jgi:exopolysaccharide biosynthesis polyprenyl glycosylphosphotransferase
MMITDVVAVLAALAIGLQVSMYHTFGTQVGFRTAFERGTPLAVQLGYLGWFVAALLVVNRTTGLYDQVLTQRILHEMRKSVQACLTAGILLCGALYMMHNTAISRAVVVSLVVFSCVFICANRLAWRQLFARRHKRGLDTRNVLVIGTNRVGDAIRKQLQKHNRLGREFKGFVQLTRPSADDVDPSLIVGSIAQLRQLTRQLFVDEVILAEDCSTASILNLVDEARELGIDVLTLPGIYDDFTPDMPVEFLGDFLVVPLHREDGRAIARFTKRVCDLVFSVLGLLAIAPTFLVIALAIRLDSPGPIFYVSERIGRKGRVFRCLKFRTMCNDAERLKAQLMHKNERDGILFKMTNDPRITRVGRILRKYSLDELPQIINVIRGEMSLVGPRPPIASEVERYELEHYRRLEVTPGLTGLWQVAARQDPSFERYVAMDITYVENWSFWLDVKILVRTAAVVCRGTGS